MDTLLFQIATVVFGLIIGSFLTACIYRIPYGREKGPGDLDDYLEDDDDSIPEADEDEEGERISILYPRRSFCPECKEQLLWKHNIPLFSWLFLGGKCAFCKTRIPFTYPLVEILTALTAFLAYNFFDPFAGTIVFAFCSALIVLSFIDIEYYILPNVITFPGMGIGIAMALINQFFHVFPAPVVPGIEQSFYGLLAGGGFLFAIAETYYLIRRRVGLGFGDVKLLAMTGLIFGWECSLYTIFIGSLAGTVIGISQLILLRQGIGKPLPFGPYLAIGTYLFFFWPELPSIILGYLYPQLM